MWSTVGTNAVTARSVSGDGVRAVSKCQKVGRCTKLVPKSTALKVARIPCARKSAVSVFYRNDSLYATARVGRASTSTCAAASSEVRLNCASFGVFPRRYCGNIYKRGFLPC
eukprot:3470768-Pyramimonas_sp.AAC.1